MDKIKRFINLNELKMQKKEMQQVVGGNNSIVATILYEIKPINNPQLCYGIVTRYSIIIPANVTNQQIGG